MPEIAEKSTVGHLRIVLPKSEHERIREAARRLGLGMSAYLRLATMERLERDEASRRQSAS